MIKSIQITSQVMKDRIKRRKISFKPGPNLIIGPNGSGKSSLLDIFTSTPNRQKANCVLDFTPGNYYAFDFEKQNPRKSHQFSTSLDIVSRFQSHGQSNKLIISSMTQDEGKGALFFLDEPEQALDIDGIEYLLTCVKDSEASQIIIVTHHPVIILNPMFNVIEMVRGYKNKVRESIKGLTNG